MSHLGELEQLILFAVTALGDDAYGGAIRAHIEERSGRIVSSGAISTTLGRLEERYFINDPDAVTDNEYRSGFGHGIHRRGAAWRHSA